MGSRGRKRTDVFVGRLGEGGEGIGKENGGGRGRHGGREWVAICGC
jgi:hypothetical protein